MERSEDDYKHMFLIATLEDAGDGGLIIRIPPEVAAKENLKAGEKVEMDRRPWWVDDPTHPYYEDPDKEEVVWSREEYEAFVEAASAYQEDFVNG